MQFCTEKTYILQRPLTTVKGSWAVKIIVSLFDSVLTAQDRVGRCILLFIFLYIFPHFLMIFNAYSDVTGLHNIIVL